MAEGNFNEEGGFKRQIGKEKFPNPKPQTPNPFYFYNK